MLAIVQKGDSVLRKIAKEVPEKEIKSPKIAAILGRMKTALDSQEDGVAIAAPQIGVSLRIFVVSERALDLSAPQSEAARQTGVPDEAGQRRKKPKDPSKVYGHMVFINPVMTKISKTKSLLEEGCLSVRYAYGKVNRAAKATAKAFNEKGEKFTRGASGLMAQIFQHEIDHLDGVLFIDKAVDVKEMPPEQVVSK